MHKLIPTTNSSNMNKLKKENVICNSLRRPGPMIGVIITNACCTKKTVKKNTLYLAGTLTFQNLKHLNV